MWELKKASKLLVRLATLRRASARSAEKGLGGNTLADPLRTMLVWEGNFGKQLQSLTAVPASWPSLLPPLVAGWDRSKFSSSEIFPPQAEHIFAGIVLVRPG